MPEIRPLTEGDLGAVTEMLRDRIRGWNHDARFLDETVLNHPWADPDYPSLVAVGGDKAILGFIGVQARRMTINGREARGVCCSHLAVSADPSAGPTGALLLSKLLRGNQALTWSDSANDPVVRMWLAFGGHLDHTRACDWMLVLRPARWMRSIAGLAIRRRPIDRATVPVGAFPAHGIGGLRGARRRAHRDPRVSGETADAAAVIECLPELTQKWAIAVDHDKEHLEHQLALIGRRSGQVICRLVLRDEQPIGWYAYVQKARGIAAVLHVGATSKNSDAVLSEMIEYATASGASLLTGRLEPHLDESLSKRMPAIGFARRPVIHARDPELRAALATSNGLLTRLDSEWFVR